MGGKIRGWDIRSEDVLPFIPNTPLECYTGIAIRSGVYKKEQYGMRLLLGIIDALKEMAKRGIIIEKLYTVSDTPDGIKLSRNLGFEEKSPAIGGTFKQYILNVLQPDTPSAVEYGKLLDECTYNKTLKT